MRCQGLEETPPPVHLSRCLVVHQLALFLDLSRYLRGGPGGLVGAGRSSPATEHPHPGTHENTKRQRQGQGLGGCWGSQRIDRTAAYRGSTKRRFPGQLLQVNVDELANVDLNLPRL